MIFIVVKFKPKPEYVESFPELVAEFTAATRNEPGNLWFEWSRSVDDPNEFVLVEAFTDDGAGRQCECAAHPAPASRFFPCLAATCVRNERPPRSARSTRGRAGQPRAGPAGPVQ